MRPITILVLLLDYNNFSAFVIATASANSMWLFRLMTLWTFYNSNFIQSIGRSPSFISSLFRSFPFWYRQLKHLLNHLEKVPSIFQISNLKNLSHNHRFQDLNLSRIVDTNLCSLHCKEISLVGNL